MEYHILRWTGSPSEDLLNVPNVLIESLQDLPTYGSSHHHDICLSTSTPMGRTLQEATLGCTPMDHAQPLDLTTYLGSHPCTQWPTSALTVSHSWTESVRPHCTSQTQKFITQTSYLLVSNLSRTPVPVNQPIYRSPCIHLSA